MSGADAKEVAVGNRAEETCRTGQFPFTPFIGVANSKNLSVVLTIGIAAGAANSSHQGLFSVCASALTLALTASPTEPDNPLGGALRGFLPPGMSGGSAFV